MFKGMRWAELNELIDAGTHCCTLLESVLFEQGEMLKQDFQPVSVQLSSMGEVAGCGQNLLVDGEDLVQGSLIDVQCWESCAHGRWCQLNDVKPPRAKTCSGVHQALYAAQRCSSATQIGAWGIRDAGQPPTWKEVIANEHAEQDKVVHNMLQTEREWQGKTAKFQLQVVPHKPGNSVLESCQRIASAKTVVLP